MDLPLKFCSPYLILTLAFCLIGVDETAGRNSSSQFDASERPSCKW